MQIPCSNCGQQVRIEASQLGSVVACPRCHRQMSLPAASHVASDADEEAIGHRSHWFENSVSTVASLLFHMALVLVLALITYGQPGIVGEGEEVGIGQLPEVSLNESETELSESAAEKSAAELDSDMSLEVEAPSLTDPSDDSSMSLSDLASPSAGGAAGEFDLGSVSVGSGMAGGGSWDGMLQTLRRNGLDVVIAFDSTSSMSGEIAEVKSQIERIGKTLLKLVPKARVGLVTYRDVGDAYVVQGMPLSKEVGEMRSFLYGVSAGGGGDAPEAVDQGLKWAVVNNDFRTRARKVILIFGDAPPHSENLSTCLKLASDFNLQQDGVVSTVTCRRGRRMPEFQQIADSGGGEAFLTTDEQQIMTQLVVLVFGARHREKVLEAFDLLGK